MRYFILCTLILTSIITTEAWASLSSSATANDGTDTAQFKPEQIDSSFHPLRIALGVCEDRIIANEKMQVDLQNPNILRLDRLCEFGERAGYPMNFSRTIKDRANEYGDKILEEDIISSVESLQKDINKYENLKNGINYAISNKKIIPIVYISIFCIYKTGNEGVDTKCLERSYQFFEPPYYKIICDLLKKAASTAPSLLQEINNTENILNNVFNIEISNKKDINIIFDKTKAKEAIIKMLKEQLNKKTINKQEHNSIDQYIGNYILKHSERIGGDNIPLKPTITLSTAYNDFNDAITPLFNQNVKLDNITVNDTASSKTTPNTQSLSQTNHSTTCNINQSISAIGLDDLNNTNNNLLKNFETFINDSAIEGGLIEEQGRYVFWIISPITDRLITKTQNGVDGTHETLRELLIEAKLLETTKVP